MDSTQGPVAEGNPQRRIPIARPDITQDEIDYVTSCIKSGWISQGKYVAEAEAKLCEITGRKHAICVSSGTAALHLALLALKNRMMLN